MLSILLLARKQTRETNMSRKRSTYKNPKARTGATQQNEQSFFVGIAKTLQTGKELLDSGRDFLGSLMEGAKMLKDSGIGSAIPDIFSTRVAPPASPVSMNLETAYKVLNATADTTDEELKSAYRALSRKLHPDKKGGSAELQSMVNTAYDVVCKYRKQQQQEQKQEQKQE